jgi:hypothetical protein
MGLGFLGGIFLGDVDSSKLLSYGFIKEINPFIVCKYDNITY